jgi:hypothetical protein
VLSGLDSKGPHNGGSPTSTMTGDDPMDESSSSLAIWRRPLGVELPERALVSASSFRIASSSRSNLQVDIIVRRQRSSRMVITYLRPKTSM